VAVSGFRRCSARVGLGVDAVFFNAQVVVDRRGRLVAVYRKSHLYFEPNFDQPLVPDVVWFDTDFGVRFGAIICFDIMFAEPVTSLRRLGISSFVYSTWWVNKAPLINGVQTQAAFARVFNATLLAAGIGVNNQISGSGIYVG
jgi:predicted amidohydrolase